MKTLHIDAYPDCRQFPVDEVCDKLVRELEAMDFNAKDITVETNSKDINGVENKYVEFIKGKDFVVYFRRMCLRNERKHIYDDIASVFQIIIPKKTLQVFSDESGPNLFVYSGDNYEKDKDQWLHGPNTYRFGKQLPSNHFIGACNCTTDKNFYISEYSLLSKEFHIHRGKRSKYLFSVKNPTFFVSTNEVLDKFKQYLENVLANLIPADTAIPGE